MPNRNQSLIPNNQDNAPNKSYGKRFIQKTLQTNKEILLKQQVLSGIMLFGVPIFTGFYFGLVAGVSFGTAVLYALSSIGIILLIVLFISIVRTPALLDQERTQTINQLNIQINALVRRVEVNQKAINLGRTEIQEPKLEPNVICIRFYLAPVTEDENHIYYELNQNEFEFFTGIIAEFYNEPIPNKTVSKLKEVQAQILL